MKTSLIVPVSMLALLWSATAFAEDPNPNAANATTHVSVGSDWPKAELIRELGTSYGTGTVGGRAATVTTVHLEKICRAPCAADLPTEGTYYVDAPGMHARKFELPAGKKTLDLKIVGASSTPLALSGYATLVGGATALVGGLVWGIFASSDGTLESRKNAAGQFETYRQPMNTSAFQTMTLIGAGVMVAGIVGLVLLPRTHVESSEGTLDAQLSHSRKVKFTGNGLVF